MEGTFWMFEWCIMEKNSWTEDFLSLQHVEFVNLIFGNFRYVIDARIGNCRVGMEFEVELISYCG